MKIGHHSEVTNARPQGPAGKPQPKAPVAPDAAGASAAPGAAASGAAAQHTTQVREQAAVATKAQQAAATPASTQARSATASAGVSLTLTASARSTGVQGQNADFNADKVKAVKAAIEKGTFKVDANAVADRLLANAYETLVHARR